MASTGSSQRTASKACVGQKIGSIRWMGYEPWNISYWVAFLYTLGSIMWVVNGFLVFLPSVRDDIAENNLGQE